MKRLTLEATDENVLNSIKENTYNRNADVRDFVETLDEIEGNMFISLDARWGEGKTFYVRQIEKTLEFLTKRMWEEQPGKIEALKLYFQNTELNSLNVKKSYLPIYYNAWLYDNHTDPILSLLFTIMRKAETYINAELSKSIEEKIATLISAISASVGIKDVFQLSVSGEKVKEAFETKKILDDIKTAEEIRELVKEILSGAIVEKAERMVIFIDELDRCRPSYAIEMLERIKHYFDDDRVIFIVSVNKEQLVHTISKYYGYGFDSTGYLNKFFDLNAHMPTMIDFYRKSSLFTSRAPEQYYLTSIADGLNEYYKLSLRDSLIFKQRIANLPRNRVNDYTAQGACLSLFISIIIMLDIKNENEKVKFLNGESDIIDELARQVNSINRMISRFGDANAPDKFESGLEKFINTYNYVFLDTVQEIHYTKRFDVSSELKRMCIKLCNGITF